MAQLTLTITNAQLPRVIAAFNAIANQIPAPVPPIAVDQAWVEAYLKNYVRKLVRDHERAVAEQTALNAVSPPPDIA